MPMVATKKPYTLVVVPDDDPINPREDNDNFGTMICFHSRYMLGDKHDYDDTQELFTDLIHKSISERDIVSYIKAGKVDGIKLEYNRSNREWELNVYSGFFKKWYTEYTYPAPLEKVSDLSDTILEYMKWEDMLPLAEKAYCILPVYLYDHSIQSVSTRSFMGRAQHAEWDSGQVGWVYASHDKVREEFGGVTPEAIEKAEKLISGEVKEYDYYLTGQCYGFKLYENDEEVDSCWGFLGDIRDVQDNIKEFMPDECKDIVETLQDRYDDIDIEDYLEELQESEDEDDEEL